MRRAQVATTFAATIEANPGEAASSGYFLLRGAPAELQLDLTTKGEAATADEAPVVTVTGGDGSALVEEETASGSEGEYSLTLTAEQTATVDVLTATWSLSISGVAQSFTTHHEIVGARLCSLAQISEDIQASPEPTESALSDARDIAEMLLEDECGVAFRPRFGRETLDGSGGQKLLLARPKLIGVLSASIDESDVEPSEIGAYGTGALWLASSWPEGALNVTVAYEHGFQRPPLQVGRVCALLARHIATKRPTNMDDRATSYSTDEAHYTLITPGVKGMLTALPEVNAFIEAWQFPEVY